MDTAPRYLHHLREGSVFICCARLVYVDKKNSFRITKSDAFLLVFAGAILALHWWSFLESIQLSTVAVGTITFSSFPLFVTLLEPLLYHRKPDKRNIALAVMILLGVLITVPEFSFENQMFLGILTGMISALSYAVLTIINKRTADRVSSTLTAFYEQATAAVVLFPFVPGAEMQPSASDIMLLLILGVITTALAHTLFILNQARRPVTSVVGGAPDSFLFFCIFPVSETL